MENKKFRINELMNDILYNNRMYRLGTPKIPDDYYDKLVKELEELDPQNQVLIDKDYTPIEGADQVDLSVDIASLTKLSRDKHGSAYDHLIKWVTKYNLQNETFVLSSKYDGVMFLVDESVSGHKLAYKKGEGNKGYSVTHHYKKISDNGSPHNYYSVGEVLYNRKTFDTKFSDKYENGRNTIAGKTNPLSSATDDLYYADYMRYTLIDKINGEYIFDKSEQLTILNKHLNTIEVPFEVVTWDELTEEKLNELFKEWSIDYEIDGIVIDINDAQVRQRLGRETGTNNPAYARAYKGDFEDKAETTCRKLTWEITKLGNLAPRCWFDPIRLNGATVQKCYVDNAKSVIDSGLYVGAKIEVKRSGMIIPRLSKVLTPLQIDTTLLHGEYGALSKFNSESEKLEHNRFKFAQANDVIPSMCPICSGAVELTENDKGEKVNLMCINPDCGGKKLRRIVFFFKTMGSKGIGDSTLEMLYDMGYDTIDKILSLDLSFFESLEGFGKRKAEMVYNALHDCLQNISIVKLMHASGYFPKMGSDKLGIIEKYSGGFVETYNPSIKDLTDMDGIAEKSAQTYIDNAPLFREFYLKIMDYVTFNSDKKEPIKSGGKCEGWVVVFTRWRDKNIEKIIEQEGGIVKKGYSKAITHVFPAEKGFHTKKEASAIEDGKIIMDQHELKQYLDVDGYAKKDNEEKNEFSMDW